jgi:hypothetical protein
MLSNRRRFALVTAIVALGFGSACSDDPVEPPDPADEIATVRVTIGTQTVNFTEGGPNPGSITVPVGTNNVTVTFLRANNSTVTLDGNEFEIQLNSQNTARVTFERTAPFAGNLRGVAAGSAAVVVVQLYHKQEMHADFGPHNLNVTVQ